MVHDASEEHGEANEVGELLRNTTILTNNYDGAEELIIGEGAILQKIEDPRDVGLDVNDGAEDEEDLSARPTATVNTTKPNPLPKSFVVICIVLFSEAFVASMLFPYVYHAFFIFMH